MSDALRTSLALVALIAAACGPSETELRAQRNAAMTDAANIESAVILYRVRHPGGDCPTIAAVREAGELDAADAITDPWEHDFVIRCESDDVEVVSPGPDGEAGTEDDVRAP